MNMLKKVGLTGIMILVCHFALIFPSQTTETIWGIFLATVFDWLFSIEDPTPRN